jgi:hypothetical protein
MKIMAYLFEGKETRCLPSTQDNQLQRNDRVKITRDLVAGGATTTDG